MLSVSGLFAKSAVRPRGSCISRSGAPHASAPAIASAPKRCNIGHRSYFSSVGVRVKAAGSGAPASMPKRSNSTMTQQTSSSSLPELDIDLSPRMALQMEPFGEDMGAHESEFAMQDDEDLFQKSLQPGRRYLPLETQMTLVRIRRTSPQGFFTSMDRNMAHVLGTSDSNQASLLKGTIEPPLSKHDEETLKKRSTSKSKHVPLEIDPEYRRTIDTRYAKHLMPLQGQYDASEFGLIEFEKLRALYGPMLSAQFDLETQAVNLEICRSMASTDNVTALGRGSEMGPARTLVRQWYHPLTNALKQKIAHELTRTKTSKLAANISLVRPEILAAITLHSTIGQTLSHQDGTQYTQLAKAIAETIQAQINYETLKSYIPEFLDSKYGPKAVYSQQVIAKLAKNRLQMPNEPEQGDFSEAVQNASTDAESAVTEGIFANSQQEDTPINRLAAADSWSEPQQRGAFSASSLSSFSSSSSLPHPALQGTRFPGRKSPAELGAPHAKHWSMNLKQEVGKFLLSTLVEVATFTHVTENGVKHEKQAFEVEVPKSTANSAVTIRNIRLADAILENISYEHVLQEANHIRHYPMLIPPRPWKGPEDGGYFLYPASVLRYYNYEQQMKPMYEQQDQLSLLYESLTVLGETPWRINKDVYNVVKQAWAEGGAVADIPSRTDLPLPVPGAEGKTPQWYKQLQRIQTENYNKNSLRCDLLLKLQVAEKFSEDVMYFPHNMDFRGRVYPIPPHLNHMGSDLCRGLLTFAEGMPLGPRGLYWLKIQLANFHGQDKIPFEQRVRWAEEHFPEVEDSATKPLRGRRWWLKAEDPWQCLAICFELHRALNHPEGPEKYVSQLPIHQDGTCNGLQHYAALGGDEQGAKSVNLLPADRPQDVYADVAALVQARIAQDAANGVEIANMLKGQVNRRIIKQTVMTSVYGVTFIGARQQIANALKDRGVLNEDARYQASVYLARATFDSIGEMFTGARSIMDWFATCASLVAKRNRLVSWTTPLGLPVSQPYKKISKKNILKTAFQTITLENESSGPVNSLRQRSAFPPNFVHSLDSSHMLLTALACKRKGIMFSSVHDSYWSHACNVDQMNVELRDAFVELHRRPLLQRLYDQFAKDNPDISFPPVPERGSFDLDLVKQSPYFFN